jgi:stage III sporulation protein AB
MIIKIIGAVLIIGGACGLGIYYGMGCEYRKRELEQLKRAFRIMYSETEFGHTHLAEICERAAEVCDEKISAVFKYFKDKLRDGDIEDISELWANCVETAFTDTHIKEEDINALLGLGSCLGADDISLQLKALDSMTDYIEDKCNTLSSVGEKNMRLCRSTGALIGIFVVIMLF